MCPERIVSPRKTASLGFFLYVLAAEMTPHALLNCPSTSPFRGSRWYNSPESISCFTSMLYLSMYSLTTQKIPFLARYVTTLKLGLRHGASWMNLSEAWRSWDSSNGAKFLLPSEAHLIYLHAKNRVYSLTRLPFTAGACSTSIDP